ncbi:Sulfate adenylyltransferase [hydrothermal vent metagenome]|uniref:sulfate adenylyltransferase n=1 Tax=hydrothermal vent metagenome TaxID=652676 RepID=A0A3B1BJ83_9ZZZZ
MAKPFVKLLVEPEVWVEAANISDGVLSPLTGFMDSKDYHGVVENMRLDSGEPWTIPVTLDVDEEKVQDIVKAGKVALTVSDGSAVAEVEVEDVFKVDLSIDLVKVFGTDSMEHPGVRKEAGRSSYRVGGAVRLLRKTDSIYPDYNMTPKQTRKRFKDMGWKTIVGFQTRNPIHRSHEYLQRVGLELADGLFIQPLIGWKKADDLSPEAVMNSYKMMLAEFYPSGRAILGTLLTPMRYAGPREAVFHAIIRRNFGCTHFIVGRDHAGVGGFYEKYAAHKLCHKFTDLGIETLTLCGPYHCGKCGTIVTEKTCPHGEQFALDISGTQVRSMLKNGKRPPIEYMRPEIADTLIALAESGNLFVGDNVNGL